MAKDELSPAMLRALDAIEHGKVTVRHGKPTGCRRDTLDALIRRGLVFVGEWVGGREGANMVGLRPTGPAAEPDRDQSHAEVWSCDVGPDCDHSGSCGAWKLIAIHHDGRTGSSAHGMRVVRVPNSNVDSAGKCHSCGVIPRAPQVGDLVQSWDQCGPFGQVVRMHSTSGNEFMAYVSSTDFPQGQRLVRAATLEVVRPGSADHRWMILAELCWIHRDQYKLREVVQAMVADIGADPDDMARTDTIIKWATRQIRRDYWGRRIDPEIVPSFRRIEDALEEWFTGAW